MTSYRRLCCPVMVLLTFSLWGTSFAGHIEKDVPLHGATLWDICADPKVVLGNYSNCYDLNEKYADAHGQSMAGQCRSLEILNNCMIYNVSLQCPVVYKQYYSQMEDFLPVAYLYCGSNVGLIPVEEFEHIAWIELRRMYLLWLKSITVSPTSQPEMTTEPDPNIKGGLNDTMTSNVTRVIRQVTESFIRSTTVPPARETAEPKASLLDILITVAPNYEESADVTTAETTN